MKRVLVVDDIPSNRKIATVILEKFGWQTAEEPGGPEALARKDLAEFSHILLDINMPEMDGIQVCHRLREQDGLKHLKIIAYTAHAMEKEKSQIMSEGFDDIIIKPISVDTLLAVLNNVSP